MAEARHLTTAELEAGLDHIRRSPPDGGVLALLVRRPRIEEREVLEEGELDLHLGLVGDTWSARPSSRTADGSPHPDMQLNVMNARAIALIAALFGFVGVTSYSWAGAKILFYVFLFLAVLALLVGGSRRHTFVG